MRTRFWIATVAAVMALGLVSETAGAAELSKAAFIAAGDKICAAGNKKLETEGNKVFANLGANELPSAAAIKSFVGKAVPILRTQVKDLRKLTPPKADQATIKKLLDDVDAVITKLSKDPNLMLSDTLFTAVNKRSATYGFKACGE